MPIPIYNEQYESYIDHNIESAKSIIIKYAFMYIWIQSESESEFEFEFELELREKLQRLEKPKNTRSGAAGLSVIIQLSSTTAKVLYENSLVARSLQYS